MNKSYKNILVHSIANLGDTVLSVGALGLLRKAYPEAKITFMVRHGLEDVFKNNPYFNEVITYKYKSKGDYLSVWRKAQDLKKYHFDLVVSLDRRPRLALLMWLAGIKERIGPEMIYIEKKTMATKLYTKMVKIPYPLETKLQAENFQEIIRLFTGRKESIRPVLGKADAKDRELIKKLMAEELPKGKKRVPVCVRALYPIKNWPQGRFAELLDRLNQKYPQLTFFFIGTSDDRAYAEQIKELCQSQVKNLCGRTNLAQLSALFEESDMLLTILLRLRGCRLPVYFAAALILLWLPLLQIFLYRY